MSPIIKEYKMVNANGESYGDLAIILKQLRNVTEYDINVKLGELDMVHYTKWVRQKYTVEYSAELKEAIQVLKNWATRYKELLTTLDFKPSVIKDRIGNEVYSLQIFSKMGEPEGRTSLYVSYDEIHDYYREESDFVYEFGKEMRGVPKDKQYEKALKIISDENFMLQKRQDLLKQVIYREVNGLNLLIAEVVGKNLDFVTFNTIKSLSLEKDDDLLIVKNKIKNATNSEIANLYLKVLDTMKYQKAESFEPVKENKEAFSFFLERNFFEYPENATFTETQYWRNKFVYGRQIIK